MSTAIIAAIWIAVGLWLVWRSGPRGISADAMLVALWPIHVVMFLMRGK